MLYPIAEIFDLLFTQEDEQTRNWAQNDRTTMTCLAKISKA